MTAEERAAKIATLLGLKYDHATMDFLAAHIQEAEEDALGRDLQRRMAAGCAMTLEKLKVIRERVSNFAKREGINELVEPSACIGWLNDAILDRKDLVAYCEYLELQLQYLAEDRPDSQKLKDIGYNAAMEEAAKMMLDERYWERGRPTKHSRAGMAEVIRKAKVEIK